MSAQPVHTQLIDAEILAAAKVLMRSGADLYMAAQLLGVFAADLDRALWRSIGVC